VKNSVLRVIVVPEGSESRTYEIGYRRLWAFKILSFTVFVITVFLAVTWGRMASRVAHFVELEAEVAALRDDQLRFFALLQQVDNLEEQYDRLRSLFAPKSSSNSLGLWLPSSNSSNYLPMKDQNTGVPDTWPLTERGFITQGLLDNDSGAHLGVDIAVPTGSYIRAAGTGYVVDVGDDAIYGRYVRIKHKDGYETLYAHASVTSVSIGELVRKKEVIAFSGSTGRSTAPHLHFEILLDGAAVDPLELVQYP
jgi:murein DD-endopeptidase MepM/ murein hydrolase activator NlpD